MTGYPEKRDVIILGAGLAGLSAGFHLKKKTYTIIERQNVLGGTARSYKVGPFTFDITGHLLHLHNDYTRNLIRGLLKNQFYSCIRNTSIFSHNTHTRYPFQASTYGLPDDVIKECVLGFLDTYLENKHKRDNPLEFDQWCQQLFGAGITKHFMKPYNEKLYQVPINRMTSEWCGQFVPMPKLEDVIEGALRDKGKAFGYNTTFLYPKKGGIQSLAEALGSKLKSIRLNTEIRSIDWKKKQAYLSTGQRIHYSQLVNTIPLTHLLRLMKSLPISIQKSAAKLRHSGILCLNIGVNRAKISDKSWIYFPEKKFPFYRVGFPMNFTPHVVPRGCSSMYVELPMKPVKNLSQAEILRRTRKGLEEAGILRKSDKILIAQFLPVPFAYVIYDKDRTIALKIIFNFLNKASIQSIGRYGAWKYSFMEEAILDGKKAAERIEKR